LQGARKIERHTRLFGGKRRTGDESKSHADCESS
jgi:hypothetical protein